MARSLTGKAGARLGQAFVRGVDVPGAPWTASSYQAGG